MNMLLSLPVASNWLNDQRRYSQARSAPATRPVTPHRWPSSQIGIGKLRPPLLRNNGPSVQASWAAGSTSVKSKYHISNCSSTGTLRKNST